jgi:hypothetical protein
MATHIDFQGDADAGLADEGDTFWTRDMPLASTLLMLGCDVVGTEYNVDPREGYPVGWLGFRKTEQLRYDVGAYFRDELQVSPRRFYVAFRQVKALVLTSKKITDEKD